MADPARLDLDPHRPGARLRYLPFDHLQRPAGSRNLHYAHRCHDTLRLKHTHYDVQVTFCASPVRMSKWSRIREQLPERRERLT